MNRREAIRQAALGAAAAAVWASLPARTWAALAPVEGWSADEETFLTAIGDTILPDTPGAPGAGSVGIGRFIAMMTREWSPAAATAALRRGLRELAAESQRRGAAFPSLPREQRESLLTAYEAKSAASTPRGGIDPFRHVKELTLLGYFTSETGATKALRYDPVPGTYRGSVRLGPGDRSWAQ